MFGRFLIIALPLRVVNVSQTLLRTIRSQGIPLRLSLFTPTSLRELFPSRNILRPNKLTVALFPHLRHETYPPSILSLHRPTRTTSVSNVPEAAASISRRIFALPLELWAHFRATIAFPLHLARHECTYKRKQLVGIRDERAAVLGSLVALRDELNAALETKNASEIRDSLTAFCMQCSIALGTSNGETPELLAQLEELTNTTLPAHISSHNMQIQTYALRRPSRLTLIWPKLVLLPPLGLYTARLAYQSRDSLQHMAWDAVETVKGFWNDWLLGPLKDVVKTVRAGSDDGVIITKESVRADLDVSYPRAT